MLIFVWYDTRLKMSALVSPPLQAPTVHGCAATERPFISRYLTKISYPDLQHTIFLLTLDDKLHLSPVDKPSPRVLDVGCGTGIWSIEFGRVPTTSLVPGPVAFQTLTCLSADENPDAEVWPEPASILVQQKGILTKRAGYWH